MPWADSWAVSKMTLAGLAFISRLAPHPPYSLSASTADGERRKGGPVRVILLPVKRDPYLSMHLGRTKVHLSVQRQKHGGRDVGAILDRNGRKSFVGYYHEHEVGEIITQARERLQASFGTSTVRLDTGKAAYLIRHSKDAPSFFVSRGGKDIARGKVASNSCFLDTHDEGLVAIAPEVLLLLAFHDLPRILP